MEGRPSSMSRKHTEKGRRAIKRGPEVTQLNVDCHRDIVALFRVTAGKRNMTQRRALEIALQSWCGLPQRDVRRELDELC